jgi:hypothetical protein
MKNIESYDEFLNEALNPTESKKMIRTVIEKSQAEFQSTNGLDDLVSSLYALVRTEKFMQK